MRIIIGDVESGAFASTHSTERMLLTGSHIKTGLCAHIFDSLFFGRITCKNNTRNKVYENTSKTYILFVAVYLNPVSRECFTILTCLRFCKKTKWRLFIKAFY